MRSSFVFIAGLVAFVSTGCSTAGIAPVPVAAADANAGMQAAYRDAALEMRSTSTAVAPATRTLPARHLYVGNAATNTITIYDKLARGNVAPVRTIGGPNSGIACLKQFAVDDRGYVYVAVYSANGGSNGACYTNGGGEILVFAPDANGDAGPVRTIAGPSTTIGSAAAVAVGPDGSVYVGSESISIANSGVDGTLLRFAPGAAGDVAPAASSAVTCENFTGITTDPVEGLITASGPCSASSVSANVGYYARDLSTGGAAISYDSTGPVASDPATHTYLGVGTAFAPRIDRYADGSTGAYAPDGPVAPAVTPSLVSSLAIATCPAAVAVGPMREIYVAGTCPNSVEAFAPDAAGSTAPLRTIAGPATQLATPADVVVGP